MRSTAVFAVTIAMLLLLTSPVASKELPDGPVAVMTPSGRVLILRGTEAKLFVKDANSLQCNESCDSPAAAARVAQGPGSGSTSDRYLVAFKGWAGGVDFNWTAAPWFYPSTKEEPAYLVWPIGTDDGSGAWAVWEDATPRMERIILGAAGSSASTLPFTAGSFPLSVLVGVAIALAGAGTVLIRLSRIQGVVPGARSSNPSRST